MMQSLYFHSHVYKMRQRSLLVQQTFVELQYGPGTENSPLNDRRHRMEKAIMLIGIVLSVFWLNVCIISYPDVL